MFSSSLPGKKVGKVFNTWFHGYHSCVVPAFELLEISVPKPQVCIQMCLTLHLAAFLFKHIGGMCSVVCLGLISV